MERYLELLRKTERNLINNIRQKREKERDKILYDTLNKIAEKTESGKRKETILWLPVLLKLESELLKFGYTIFDYSENDKLLKLLIERYEPYVEDTIKKGAVTVGIFWVVKNRLFLHRQFKVKENECKIIDATYSHFREWELHEIDYENADFATFPRGRIMFDKKENQHVIFADKCITSEQIEQIARLCYITSYRIERDEHYKCDKCIGEDI